MLGKRRGARFERINYTQEAPPSHRQWAEDDDSEEENLMMRGFKKMAVDKKKEESKVVEDVEGKRREEKMKVEIVSGRGEMRQECYWLYHTIKISTLKFPNGLDPQVSSKGIHADLIHSNGKLYYIRFQHPTLTIMPLQNLKPIDCILTIENNISTLYKLTLDHE